MPSARGAARTSRVSGSGARPCSSSRSARRNAARTSEPPAKASGSGGTCAGCGSTSASRVASSSACSARPASARPARCDGPDAVAGEAERVVHGTAGERPDLRQVARRDVDRPAPRVLDAAARQRREHRDEVLVRGARGRGVDLDAAVHARADRELPAAPAERDPAVGRRAEVVHERPCVGDRLAPGPADRSSTSGTGSVSTMCDEVTESRERSGLTPRVAALSASTAAPARTRAPAVSATTSVGRHAQRAHARVLEHPHAALEQAPAQAEREPRGLDRRVVGHEHAARGSGPSRSARRTASRSSATSRSPAPCAERARRRRRRGRVPSRRA